jgi:Zn-dependent peptidase ImmA (M78 family)
VKSAPFYDYDTEISAPASHIADQYMKLQGCGEFPIEPEMIAERFFGLRVMPVKRIYRTLGVISGIDATQSVLFVDEEIYMNDGTQHLARQAIAHELGHIVYDSPMLRVDAPQTAAEAYAKHAQMKSERKIETRANMFGGALLAPRRQLLTEAGEILSRGIQDLQQSNPQMNVDTVFRALSGEKLTSKFGVSTEVIEWRLKNEEFLQLLNLHQNQPLAEIDVEEILQLCSIESRKAAPSITERVKRLLPDELLAMIEA